MNKKNITPSTAVAIIRKLNKNHIPHSESESNEFLIKNMKFYITLARTTLWKFTSPLLEEENKKIRENTLLQLKELLIKVNVQLRKREMSINSNEKTKKVYNKFKRFIDMVHLVSMKLKLKDLYRKNDFMLFGLYLRTCISLVRHIEQLRFDKISMEVALLVEINGMKTVLKHLPEFSEENMGCLVIFCCEMIFDVPTNTNEKEHEGFVKEKRMKHARFSEVNPLPFINRIPNVTAVGKEFDRLEMQLLTSLLDYSSDEIKTEACENCETDNYFLTLTCGHCEFQHESCCMTGFRIKKNEKIKCKICKKSANREDWMLYKKEFKVCPYCNDNASLFSRKYRDLNVRIEYLCDRLNDEEDWEMTTFGLHFLSKKVQSFKFLFA